MQLLGYDGARWHEVCFLSPEMSKTRAGDSRLSLNFDQTNLPCCTTILVVTPIVHLLSSRQFTRRIRPMDTTATPSWHRAAVLCGKRCIELISGRLQLAANKWEGWTLVRVVILWIDRKMRCWRYSKFAWRCRHARLLCTALIYMCKVGPYAQERSWDETVRV